LSKELVETNNYLKSSICIRIDPLKNSITCLVEVRKHPVPVDKYCSIWKTL